MSALRVAYLIEQCWHRVPGGTAVSVAEIARALIQRHDVEIEGLAAHHINSPSLQLPKELQIKHSKMPRQLLYRSWKAFDRPRVENLIKNVDLVHASGGAIPPTNLPIVSTVYDLSWRQNPSWFPSRGRRFAEEWLVKSLKADLVICPSETTRLDLIEAGFDSQKIRVVQLGVRHQKVESESVQILRKTYGLQKGFVLWVGTIEPRKNLPVLVEAVSKIPKLDLVIVGPNGWNIEIESIVRPIRERVRLIGQVDEKTKHEWLEAADVFCFPSLLEGFGLPVIEAMSHGTPVVTSATTATAEVAGESGLLIDPQNSEEIAEAIIKILENKDLAQSLSKKGKERSKKFSWEKTAEQTVHVYKEVVDL